MGDRRKKTSEVVKSCDVGDMVICLTLDPGPETYDFSRRKSKA